MNTVKYYTLIEAINNRNLSKTAEKLNYSQPAITQMIQSLEREYGFQLLIRKNNEVLPTREAEILLPYIRNIVYNEKSLDEQVKRINKLETGSIRIGTYNSAMMTFLPEMLGDYSDRHPGVEVIIIEGNRVELETALHTRTVDLAIISKFDFPGFEFVPLLEDEMVAAVPKGHPLAAKESITPQELFTYPLVAVEKDSDRDLQAVCQIYNLTPNIKMRAKQESTLLKLIGANLGVGIVPSLYLPMVDDKVEIRKFDSEYQKRIIGIATLSMSGLSPAAKDFIKLMQLWMEKKGE